MRQVIIVGGGPTGIVAATLLAQYGIDALVLDRWREVYPRPRAVHLDDEVFRIIARLGIGDQFRAISRPALGLRLLDNRHRVLAEFHRDSGCSANGYPQANMFDQPELEALLRDNIRRYPTVELRGDSEVTDVEPSEHGVRITYTDRGSGAVHVVEAQYVLGCDGANSVVRSQIGSTMRDFDFNQRWLVVDIATTAELDQWDGVHQVCDSHRAATYMRIGATRYRWEFQLLPGEHASEFESVDALRPLVAPWIGEIGSAELTLVRVAEYTFRAQLADRWRSGRIFLLGDAAHLTPPFIGQGMGAGLRDAMNLAWKLAAVLAGQLPDVVLATYEQERKPHARAMIRLALLVGRAMTGGGRMGEHARRRVVPRLTKLPGLGAKVVDSRTPALRRSALVTRGRLAGALCPNPVVAEGSRFDDVVGSGFVLVTLGSPSRHPAAVDVHRVTPGGELDRWLRRGRASAALVRPDRTVMNSGEIPLPLPATLG